jgi:hypothetical protein
VKSTDSDIEAAVLAAAKFSGCISLDDLRAGTAGTDVTRKEDHPLNTEESQLYFFNSSIAGTVNR